jgi:hypothetical protein
MRILIPLTDYASTRCGKEQEKRIIISTSAWVKTTYPLAMVVMHVQADTLDI